MGAAPIPANEDARLAALYRYDLLDTGPDQAFDDMVALAAYICDTPVALVTLLDADRQWLKAKVGTDVVELPRDISFCGYTILGEDLLIVEDARLDERFADNPLVALDPHIRFYAGSSLVTSDGYALGSICVLDRVPRTLSAAQQEALRVLSRQVIAQMELKRNVMEIAGVLAERRHTAELTAAKHAAEAANRAKDSFLANISHELRTPLNGILGLTELVLDSALTTEQHENLKTVKSAAHQLLGLVEDMLNCADIEPDQAPPDRSTYSLRDLLADAIAPFLARSHDQALVLRSSIHKDVPDTLIGEPRLLRQILSHLLGNAVKFTKRGSITIAVETEMVLRDGVLLHCSIADTGIGISPEHQLVIFDLFTQADGEVTRRYGGVGLGLPIALRLVTRMSGRIWVDSEVGTGSKFHFTCRQAPPQSIRA